ncbi:MAG TPA: O-antigen ligase family protein [Thermodesulfobacteriota bacterium]
MIARLNGIIERYNLVTVFLGVLLFFQPFLRHAGVRNTAFVLLVGCLVIRSASGKFRVDLKDRTVQAFFALAAAIFLSAALSPYAGESFNAIRKDFLYQAVIFFAIITQYRDAAGLRPVLLFILAGFAAVTVKVVALTDLSRLLDWLGETDVGNTGLRGYSSFATFFIPLAVAYLYSFREKRPLAAALVFFIALEIVLSVLNNHRAQVAAFLAGLFFMTLAAGRYKVLLAGALALVISVSVLLSVKPDMLERYKTILFPKTYVTNTNEGMNGRLGIWKGAVDMIEDRPVLGWGYGWKKMHHVARDGGYMERWDKKSYTYYYFGLSYGRVNPHNLFLQLLFEVGVIGLAALVAFWATIVAKAASLRRSRGPAASFVRYSALGVLVSYFIVNLANGFWVEGYGNLMMAFAAICVVLHGEGRQEPLPPGAAS